MIVLDSKALFDRFVLSDLIGVYTETLSGGGVLMLGSLMQHRMGQHTPQVEG
jgi:hypothetical protein